MTWRNASESRRIIELERELIETRNAAVTMILGMAKGISSTQASCDELAAGFEDAAKEADGPTRRLATLVALALRGA